MVTVKNSIKVGLFVVWTMLVGAYGVKAVELIAVGASIVPYYPVSRAGRYIQTVSIQGCPHELWVHSEDVASATSHLCGRYFRAPRRKQELLDLVQRERAAADRSGAKLVHR
jgi:hypothetical protein